MKKFFVTLSIILSTVMLMGIISFATEDVTNGQGEVVEVNDYEQYEDITSDSTEPSEEELKEYYEEYINQLSDMYDTYKRVETVKAKVLKISDIEKTYSMDYYSIYEIKYQTITIKILEGPYKDEVFENVQYTLTSDALNNVKIAPVHTGDVIYVSLTEDEQNVSIVPTIVSADTQVNRYGWIIALAIVAIVVMYIFMRKQSLKIILPIILLIDLVLVILVPEMINGISGIILGSISALLIIVINAILKNGLNKKAVVSIISSVIVILVMVVLVYGVNWVTRMSGSTTEVDALSETILKRNIDFEDIYLLTMILAASIIISNISSNIINKIEKSTDEDNTLKAIIDSNSCMISDNIGVIVALCISLIVPKFMVIVGQKYTFAEIINSERFLSEISRMFILIIGSCITLPITVYISKLFKIQQKVLEAKEEVAEEE